MDSNYRFHFFIDASGTFIHNYDAVAGSETPIKLVRSYSAMDAYAEILDASDYLICYSTALYENAGVVTTDASGEVILGGVIDRTAS